MANPAHRPRERLWIFVLVIAACVVGAVVHIAGLGTQADRMVANEDGARALLEGLVAAQVRYRAKAGRYGTLVELGTAGLLDDREPAAGSDGVPVLRIPGYRVEVLLPAARGSESRMLLAREGRGDVSADLRKKHFAVVARPVVPGEDGYRILYADENADVWVSEGASDEPGREANPLPVVHLTAGGPRSPLGLAWMKWTDVEAKHAGR